MMFRRFKAAVFRLSLSSTNCRICVICSPLMTLRSWASVRILKVPIKAITTADCYQSAKAEHQALGNLKAGIALHVLPQSSVRSREHPIAPGVDQRMPEPSATSVTNLAGPFCYVNARQFTRAHVPTCCIAALTAARGQGLQRQKRQSPAGSVRRSPCRPAHAAAPKLRVPRRRG